MRRLPGLLVSVRSISEADAALAGGADLIDVKEPARGALGPADPATITEIVGFVNGRRPVSAALGELAEGRLSSSVAGLDYVKWGLAGCHERVDWRGLLSAELSAAGSPGVVIVGYADWRHAGAPPLQDVLAFARNWPGAAFLLDTFEKQSNGRGRRSLLHWLPALKVVQICHQLHDAGLRVALAGSLDIRDIAALRDAGPDWFAVRRAACAGGRREMTVSRECVRTLIRALREPASCAG